MFNKIKERSFHLVLAAFLVGLFFGINISIMATASEPAHKYLDYFHRVYQIVRMEYVDIPTNKEMFYGSIRGLIQSLGDPYSRFLDENAYKELREMTTGKFIGVGIEITTRDNDVVVITPIEGSPAMEAGIMTGDIITKVNDVNIRNKKLTDIIKLIKGLPNSKVKLWIKREGIDDLLEFEIERAPIKVKSVNYNVLKESDIAYLKIINFGSDTTKDVIDALNFFNGKKLNKLIIDLRFNPGGLLTAAIEISDLFLQKDQIIVTTKGREGSGIIHEFKSEKNPIYNGKILILVNKGSASASEILSGALRDNKRARLLGNKTFGKGSVQKSFTLDDDVGVAITIAKYYTPSGALIHNKGIKPDYKVDLEIFSQKDREQIKLINKNNIVDKFVKNNIKYNQETQLKFNEFLKTNNIDFSQLGSNFILKNRMMRFKKKPIYDLEFDQQLLAGIKKISENSYE
jgi:carboxyl-terminal processing protease